MGKKIHESFLQVQINQTKKCFSKTASYIKPLKSIIDDSNNKNLI